MNNIDYSKIPVPSDHLFANELIRPKNINQDWRELKQPQYTYDEHQRWNYLFEEMMKEVPSRACDQFITGLKKLGLRNDGIPSLNEINKKLMSMTGWKLIPVPCIIPDNVHFFHLANRRFPASINIRTENNLIYSDKPDIFHDVFAHAPMLTDPDFAKFLQEYGKGGFLALHYNRLRPMAALYMYTVELGLINNDKGMRAYGAAILSSSEEIKYSLDGESPHRLGFNIERMMSTDYVLSDMQQSYFVIESFNQLYSSLKDFNLHEIFNKIEPSYQYAPSAIFDSDYVYTKGSQEYAIRGGRQSNIKPV